MTLKDNLLNGPPEAKTPRKARKQHPKGWEPRVEEAEGKANVITQPITGNPDHAELLRASDLSPNEWHIVGDVQVRRWQQTEGGPWLRYFKFTARSGKPTEDKEFQAACKQLLKHKPRAPKKRPVKHARIICLADWQAGKGEGGGSEALAERIEDLINQSTEMIKREKPDAVYLVGMGDMVERCDQSYPSQAFTTDLNQREQERFARRGILALIKSIAPHTPRIIMSCVPGNHGENRSGGKAFTTPGDNADVAVFESLIEVLEEAPAYKHVSWVIPNEDLTVVLDVAGTSVGFAHGHQFRKGGSPQQKAVNWWKGQSMGRFPIGEADVLISAHYHHWQVLSTHGRLWMQCPALDGGSRWFTDTTGEHSLPGTLTFAVDERGPRDVALISSPL